MRSFISSDLFLVSLADVTVEAAGVTFYLCLHCRISHRFLLFNLYNRKLKALNNSDHNKQWRVDFFFFFAFLFLKKFTGSNQMG